MILLRKWFLKNHLFFPPNFRHNLVFLKLVEEAIKTAEKISEHSPLIVAMIKEAVNVAYETTLQEGLRFERRMFYTTFATVNFTIFLVSLSLLSFKCYF